MKQKDRQKYTAPCIEVIAVENEGSVMAASLDPVYDGGSATRSISSGNTRNYNSASSSDLEDLINDILTVEQ